MRKSRTRTRSTNATNSTAAAEVAMSLNEQRIEAVASALTRCGASRILDVGCGEGKLIARMLHESSVRYILGMDVASRVLDSAARRLRLDEMPAMQRDRVELIHGSLMYRDERLRGFDGAAVVEVIEHLDPPRLAAFEHVLFGGMRGRPTSW